MRAEKQGWLPYALLACLSLAIISPAHAQRIRDMSLSPEESMRPDNYSNTPSYNSTAQPYLSNPGYPAPTDNAYQPAQGSRFMDHYCNDNFTPALAGGQPDTKACIDNAKVQSCGLFQKLPADAQQLLDAAISCAANAGSEDENGYLTNQRNAADCSDSDRRLQLVQKYWRDQDTVYALVFLPDLVATAGSQCLGGRP